MVGVETNSKNRYISIAAGMAGRSQAIRVRFASLPKPFHVWNYAETEQEFFVGPPREACENSAKSLDTAPQDCPPALPTDTFWAAPLLCNQSAAHFMDWHGECVCGTCVGGFKEGNTCTDDDNCQGIIHLYHEGIIPKGEYHIQVIDEACSLLRESNYSAPLTMIQAIWGDVCGPGPGGPCTKVANGVVDVANDVMGVLDKFANLNLLQKARADIEPGDDGTNNGPDFEVNVANDVNFTLAAFGGAPYPFIPGNPCDPD